LYWSFDLFLPRRESKIIIRVQTEGVHQFCFYMQGKKVKIALNSPLNLQFNA